MEVINDSVEIIKIKNILAVVAIVILVNSIFLNSNSINVQTGNGPTINPELARDLDIIGSVGTVIILLVSLYLAYSEYFISESKNKDSTGSRLQIEAYALSVIGALILLYVTVNFYQTDIEYGIVPDILS